MTENSTINTKDPAQRLDLGRRLHERQEWPSIQDAAEQLGVHVSTLYAMQREYREASGIETIAMSGGRKPLTEAQRKARDAARHAQKRTEARAAKLNGNGNGSHLVVVPPEDSAVLRARIRELEHELAETLEEMQVLQKVLMVVGRTL